MSAPYREVSSRLKRLLTEGRVIEGSLYRADRGNTPRHQLSDRATGRFRNIYIPADFADDVAAWSANWAEAKRLLKEMSAIARAELVEAITARTGRRTVAKPGRGAQGGASASRRVACRALNRRCRRVSSRKTDCKCPRRLGAAETRGAFVIRGAAAP